MIKKFPARKNETLLQDIYALLLEVKRDLKVVEAKLPYNKILSLSLESAIKRIAIAENRLAAENFIDGLYISEMIVHLKKQDPYLTWFTVQITKNQQVDLTFEPYELNIIGH